MLSVIKSDAQYHEALERATQLAELDPDPDSESGKELGVLSLILGEYETRVFPIGPGNPIAAIRFRMEQAALTPKDLVPLLGSRSRVSEVLSGKRPLSIAMIRSLHASLQIPLETLVSEPVASEPTETIEWDRFPLREMLKRGWLSLTGVTPRARISFETSRDALVEFFRPVGGVQIAASVLQKRDSVRAGKSTDRFALAAWAGRVRRVAEESKVPRRFAAESWTDEVFRELRGLSRYDVGPRLACQFLADRGIVVVIEPHLPRTRLDGAAMLRRDGTPVIGLTIRHDRLDNFWFTLFHELMHVVLHLRPSSPIRSDFTCFIDDDLDVAADTNPLELEADVAAREALVPSTSWEGSAAKYVVAAATVAQLADDVGVASAVVAGRVRREHNNYRLLSSMIGAGEVQNQFPDVEWPVTRRN